MPKPRERLRAPRFDYAKVQGYIMDRLAEEGAPLHGSQLATAKYPIHVIRRALARLTRMSGGVESTDAGYRLLAPLPTTSEASPANDPQPPQPEAPKPPVLRKTRRSVAKPNGAQVTLDAARALEIEINRRERSIGMSIEGMRIKLLFRG